jgi:hypothetical protein
VNLSARIPTWGHFGGFRHEGDPEYTLRLIDDKEQELVRLTDKDYVEIVQLFDLARRASLNVDAVIDEILSDDENALPSD